MTQPQPLPPKTRRAIVGRYTRRRDPQSIRAIAKDLGITFWRVRATLLREGVPLRGRGGARRPSGAAQ